MPNPNDYDNMEDFMRACVSTRIAEGDKRDRAVAACISIWRNRNKAIGKIGESDESSGISEQQPSDRR